MEQQRKVLRRDAKDPRKQPGVHRQLIERPFHGAGQDSSIRYGEDGPPTTASRLPPWLRQR